MKSKDAEKLFSAYLEGELSAEEEDALRAHFSEHPEDLEAYRAFEATVDLVRSLPREDVSAEFTDRVMSQVRLARANDRPMPRRLTLVPRRAWPQVMALAATLCLGFLAGTIFINVMKTPAAPGIAGQNRPALTTGSDATGDEPSALAASATGTVSDSMDVARPSFEFQRLPIHQVNSGTRKPTIVF